MTRLLSVLVVVVAGVLACAGVAAAMLPMSYFSQCDSRWSNDGIYVDYSGCVVSAEDVSEDFTGSVADAKIQAAFAEDKIQSLSSQTEIFVGQGFDKCEIPTLSQMQNWITNSPYGAVNLYIGGSCRSCPNSALTASYVSQLSQQGWKFIPTWVGPQSACWGGSCGSISNDPATAYNQGISEANAAIDVAIDLGLALADGSGTIIYYDIEGYDTTNTACRNAAKSFTSGWTAQLHARGSEAGVYGSACGSAISDFASISNVPDAIWPAHWIYSSYNSGATVWDVACLSNGLWVDHQRIRQYAGGHDETWGGVTLNIDCNVIDGIVASVGPADIIPLSGDLYGDGKDITGFYNANTAEFTFGGETDDTVNIEFADQSAEFGVVSSSSSYDRQAAEAYAKQYADNHVNGLWDTTCDCGFTYYQYGGDCAHFVSHCLAAGGLSNKGTAYATGWCEGGAQDYIILVNKMREWFTDTCIATKVSSVSQLEPGDVIVTNDYGHVVLYIGTYEGKSHQVASHTIDGIYSYTYWGSPNEYWHIITAEGKEIPLSGDLNGDDDGTHIDSYGTFNPSTAGFTFNGKTVHFGTSTDLPVMGDWDHDGKDEMGVYRPDNGDGQSEFHLVWRNWDSFINGAEVEPADRKVITFGPYPNNIPIAGDWDGDDDDDIGGFYNNKFYLYKLNWEAGTKEPYAGDPALGDPGDKPIIGDWDGDGDDDIGVFRPGASTNYFYLDQQFPLRRLPCTLGLTYRTFSLTLGT